MNPKEIKRLQARSRALRARMVSPNVVAVTSRSQPPTQHFVTVEWTNEEAIEAHCTCPWGMNGGSCCSHVMAALNLLAARQHRSISFWRSRDEATRQKHRLLRVVGEQSGAAVYMTSRPVKAQPRRAENKRHEETRGVLRSIRPSSASRGPSVPLYASRSRALSYAGAD